MTWCVCASTRTFKRLLIILIGVFTFISFYVGIRFQRSKAFVQDEVVYNKNPSVKIGRKISDILFSSGCSKRDDLHAQVLGLSAFTAGYNATVTRLLLNCQNQTTTKDSKYLRLFQESKYYRDDRVSPHINPIVILDWINSASKSKENDLIMLVDSTTVFLKVLDPSYLQYKGILRSNVKGIGQISRWYRRGRPVLPQAMLLGLGGKSSPILHLKDWKNYAVESPIVIEKRILRTILPTMISFWKILDKSNCHLVYPLTVAHHGLVQASMTSLRIDRYNDPPQGWLFIDTLTENPCNLTLSKDFFSHENFPVSLGSGNFSLGTWKYGSKWMFLDSVLPNDILDCDAWIINAPPSELWSRATRHHLPMTLSNRLAKQHAFTVCINTRLFNDAITSYKQDNCPLGFNNNKKLYLKDFISYGKGKKRSSAVAFRHKHGNSIGFSRFGDFIRDEPFNEADLPEDSTSSNIHFVFTTTCSGYQDWQSETLAITAMMCGQHGRITRILVGCTSQQKDAINRRGSINPKMLFHFSPSPPDIKGYEDYTPFNKPFGIRHWIRNSIPHVREDIIVIIDPDFYFLRPFHVDTNLRKSVKYNGIRPFRDVNDSVMQGLGIAQTWTSYLGAGPFVKRWQKDVDKICKGSSSCKVTEEDAFEYYSVGPPYALRKQDLIRLVDNYYTMAVQMRKLQPKEWMAEMLGFMLASAKNRVKYTRLQNLAITLGGDEYWGFLLHLHVNPCGDTEAPEIPEDAPPFFHACRGLTLDLEVADNSNSSTTWRFYKQFVPEDLFACDSWMLQVPPPSLWTSAKRSSRSEDLHHAYGICTLTKVLNLALKKYKTLKCTEGFNSQKKLRLVKPRPRRFLKLGAYEDVWNKVNTHKV